MVGLEICVADAEGARTAAEGGADRVELCAALEIGGLTPSWGFVEHALADAPGLAVTVLIRPRGGEFVYTAAEVEVMVADVTHFVERTRAIGDRLGFTVGALTSAAELDLATLDRLVSAAEGHRMCFHKAFDSLAKPVAALESLSAHGFSAVLTAGGLESASVQLEQLAEVVTHAPPGLEIIAAGGIRPGNVHKVVDATGVAGVHLRAPQVVVSSMKIASSYDSGARDVTSRDLVAHVARNLRNRS